MVLRNKSVYKGGEAGGKVVDMVEREGPDNEGEYERG